MILVRNWSGLLIFEPCLKAQIRMTTSQSSVRFFLGDPRALRSTTIYLYFRYYKWTNSDKKRCTIKLPTPYTVNPKDWNKKDDQLKPGRPGELKTNPALFKLKSDIKNRWAELSSDQKTISDESLRKQIEGILTGTKIKDSESDFNSAFDAYMNYLKHTQRRTDSTINKYYNLKRLLDFYSFHTGITISFENIDINFYNQFQAYLFDVEHEAPKSLDKSQRGKIKMKRNSVGKALKVLQSFLKYVYLHGLSDEMHYMKFTSFSEEVEKIALNLKDIKAIAETDFGTNYLLDEVRDVFLFACYTGQRYNDYASLRWDDIDGIYWKNTDKKTGDKRTVILLPEALSILKKYKKSMLPLPIKSNAQMNFLLKEMGLKAGLNQAVKITEIVDGKKKSITHKKYELITTHTCRRTFITIAEQFGLRREVAKNMTGHKDERTYQKYNKITPEVMAEEVYKTFQRKEGRTA